MISKFHLIYPHISTKLKLSNKRRYLSTNHNINFTEDQKKVICHSAQHAVVFGGPGSGKSLCFIARISNLINSGEAKASEILALTPTERSATYSQYILDQLTPISSTETIVSVNSLSHRLINEYSNIAKFKSGVVKENETFKMLYDKIKASECSKLFNKLTEGSRKVHIYSLFRYFSNLRASSISPDDYQLFADSLKDNLLKASLDPIQSNSLNINYLTRKYNLHNDLLEAYREYLKIKDELSILTYDDRLIHINDLLKDETIQYELLNRYKYILIDDIQDITRLQYNVLKPLVFTNKSIESRFITLIGDEDQTIFHWAGASEDIMGDILNNFNSADFFNLNINFRNDPRIFNGAARILSKVNRRFVEPIQVYNSEDKTNKFSGIHLMEYESISEEYKGIGDIIHEIQNLDNHSKIAIIVKSKRDESSLLTHLRNMNIDVPTPLGEYKEISFVMKALQLLIEPFESDFVLHDILSSGPFSLPADDLYLLTHTYYQTKKSLLSTLKEFINSKIESNEKEKYIKTIQLLRLLKLWKSNPPNDLNIAVYNIFKYSGILKNSNKDEFKTIDDNFVTFFKIIGDLSTKFNTTKPDLLWPHLKERISHVDLTFQEVSENTVYVLTPWASKSYEFDYVVIPKLNQHVWPGYHNEGDMLTDCFNQLTSVKNYEKTKEEQERKCFYSTLTRAKKGVILTRAIHSHSTNKESRISQFALEALNIPDRNLLFQKIEVMNSPTSNQKVSDKFGEMSEKKLKIPPFITTDIDINSFHSYYQCPMRYYFKYLAKVTEISSIYYLFQLSISKVFDAIKTGKVDLDKLSSFEECRRIFDQNWIDNGINPSKLPLEHYDKGMEILEVLKDADIYYGERVEYSIPFSTAIQDDNIKNPFKFTGELDRIYDDDHIVQFMTFSEKSPPNNDDILLYAKTLSYAFFKKYDKIPRKVTIEYVSSDFEMKHITYVPKAKDFETIEQLLIATAVELSTNDILPKSSHKNCKACQFNNICTASSLRKR